MGFSPSALSKTANVAVILALGTLYVVLLAVGSIAAACRRQLERGRRGAGGIVRQLQRQFGLVR